MASAREFARRVMRHYVLPVPTRDRTLRVLVPPHTVPDFRVQCLCHKVAIHAWRTAHEHACTKIIVERDALHHHEFNTIDLFQRGVLRDLGFWPGLKRVAGRVPRLLATRGMQANGAWLDTTRPVVHVPVAISGASPVAQETAHGQ